MSLRSFFLTLGVAVAVLCTSPTPALARVDARTTHPLARVYSAALRYLRVDLGFEVTERDPDSAYLLFSYVAPGDSHPSPASIELVRGDDYVKIYVSIPKLPRYHETVLRDGLLKKLEQDFGPAPAPKPPAPKDPPKDAPKPPDDDSPPTTPPQKPSSDWELEASVTAPRQ